MSGDTVHVTGLSQLQAFLDQLPVKIQKNVMRGALRAGMNVVKPVAQSDIHSISGALAKSLYVSTRTKGSTVTATLSAGRGFGKKGTPARNLPLWVEFGTAAHNVAAKAGKSLAFLNVFRKDIHHPGARPKPFMRPALDQQAQPAVIAAAEYIKARLATKEGLDTSAVLIEGDEP